MSSDRIETPRPHSSSPPRPPSLRRQHRRRMVLRRSHLPPNVDTPERRRDFERRRRRNSLDRSRWQFAVVGSRTRTFRRTSLRPSRPSSPHSDSSKSGRAHSDSVFRTSEHRRRDFDGDELQRRHASFRIRSKSDSSTASRLSGQLVRATTSLSSCRSTGHPSNRQEVAANDLGRRSSVLHERQRRLESLQDDEALFADRQLRHDASAIFKVSLRDAGKAEILSR